MPLVRPAPLLPTSSTSKTNPNPNIKHYTTLPNSASPTHALHLLHRIASLVKPIMCAHSFSIGILAEFLPSDPCLLGLNVNRTQKICLRLRRSGSGDWLGEDELVGTMLHELTHITHGPHDTKFYALLDSLTAEYQALRAKGYDGEGFFAEGRRVGQGVSHNVSPEEGRRRAVEAAERRARAGALTRGSGARLGGGGGMSVGGGKGKSMRELVAEAAERRASDAKACGSGDGHLEAEMVGELEKVESMEREGIITIPDDAPAPAPTRVASEGGKGKREAVQVITIEDSPPPEPKEKELAFLPEETRPTPPPPKRPRPESPPMATIWACSACTLHNPLQTLRCSLCETERPQTDAERKKKER
ncbi:hypothetical protein YB2330_006232 [Saitoella coloradoensis]